MLYFLDTVRVSASRTNVVKTWATLLLVFMVVLYIIARSCLHLHEGWAWVRAFAEAGMIGALADWFAVVALFRHPLGLQIPHTAIVRKKKDDIGARLGEFVRTNFLAADVLKEQMVKYALVPKLFQWLAIPENNAHITNLLRDQVIEISQKADQREFSDRLASSLCMKLEGLPLEKGVGSWIGSSMHGDEFRHVVAPLLGKLATGIGDQREWVEQEAGDRVASTRSKLLTRLTKGVTKAFSGHVVNQVSDQLKEASEDLNHPLYEKLEHSLQELSTELQGDAPNSEWAAWRQQVMSSDKTTRTLSTLLMQAGGVALEERDRIALTLQGGITKFSQQVLDNPAERARWEGEFGKVIEEFADQYGDGFEKLIVERVKEWDASALSDTLERSVGADLQYIRINGSLIGGVIGLVLHGVGLLIWGH